MADFDAQLPIRSIASQATVSLSDAAFVTINPAEDFAQGSTTSGQRGVLIQAAVNTIAPTYTTGQTNPLSLTTSGGLRTDVMQWGGTLTTLGQKTMADSVPVVIASNQSPVEVVFTDNAQFEDPQYNTVAAVAAGASSTQTYSPGSTVELDGIDASASGQMKVEIQWGTTGGEVTKAVFFTSKGDLKLQWRLPNPVQITNTMSVKVIRTNTDNQAMDVYSTVQVH